MIWLIENIATVIIAAVIIAAAAFAIIKIIKDKKSGKSSCSCGCGVCVNKDNCNKK